MVTWLEWAIDLLGLIAAWLLGRRARAGWWFTVAVQVMWVWVAVATRQWAFLPLSPIYAAAAIRGWVRWGREHPRRGDRMTWLAVVWSWLWANTAGNILASVMCGVAVWFWKIRPHLQRQQAHREAAEERHEQVEGWLAGLHDRFDVLERPGQHAEREAFHGQLPEGGEVE